MKSFTFFAKENVDCTFFVELSVPAGTKTGRLYITPEGGNESEIVGAVTSVSNTGANITVPGSWITDNNFPATFRLQINVDGGSFSDYATGLGMIRKPGASTSQSQYVTDAAQFESIQEAVNYAPSGSVVWFDSRVNWTLTDSVTISKPLTLIGDQTLIQQNGVGKAVFEVTSSDVHFRGLDLRGRQSAAIVSAERAINFTGTINAYLKRITVNECRFRQWGQASIYGSFIENFDLSNNDITDTAYVGIGIISGADGKIHNNVITNITLGGTANGYGIFASYNETSGITNSPLPRDISIEGNHIYDVDWEGIDTHAGIRIGIRNNYVKNCKVAIAVVPGRNTHATLYTLSPKDCRVEGNSIVGQTTGTDRRPGIQFIGCSTAVGFHNTTDFATGVIIGNTLSKCGRPDLTSGAACNLQDTSGVVVMGNVFSEPAVSAIRLDYNNRDAVIADNTAIDVYADGAAYAAMIQSSSAWNTATLGGNRLIRGTKAATIVNSIGYRMGSALGTLIVDRGNDFLSAPSPYSGGGSLLGLIQTDQRGIRNAFVSSLPTWGVWQRGSQLLSTAAAASTSPGWVCTTAGGLSSAVWAGTTSYSAATWVRTASGKILECVVAGTSSGVEPNPSTVGELVVDGTVTWIYRSATTAVFKTMPALGA